MPNLIKTTLALLPFFGLDNNIDVYAKVIDSQSLFESSSIIITFKPFCEMTWACTIKRFTPVAKSES
jgi:hypothetical protein